MRSVSLALLASLGACGFSINAGSDIDASTGSDGSGSGDGGIDGDATETVDAMLDMPPAAGWTAPQSVGISNAADPTLTGNMLDIWFIQSGDIYHASRPSLFQAFGMATKVSELSTASAESTPEISLGGQTITFARLVGNNDVYEASWDVGSQSWTSIQQFTDLNTTDHEQSAAVSTDRLFLAMTRSAPAGSPDIYYSSRTSVGENWSNPTPAIELNSMMSDNNVFLAANKLTVCFDSQRASASTDIYCATRASAAQPFDTPAPMTGINSAQNDSDPWLSADGNVMVFVSDRDGTTRIYFSIRT